jgi:gluconokinase
MLDDILFVHLEGTPDTIQQRLEQRLAYFMPASLLTSQLAALEAPQPQLEHCMVLAIDRPPDDLAGQILTYLAIEAA